MLSFLIRGLARYTAASIMEHKAKSSYNNTLSMPSDVERQLSDAFLCAWQTDMLWLIPFVQATGYQIVIENPKSHEQIVIDPNAKELPTLTLEWMQKYNKQELLEWIEKEKERKCQEEEEKQKKLQARCIAEARGRAKFGNIFTPSEQDIQDVLRAQKDAN